MAVTDLKDQFTVQRGELEEAISVHIKWPFQLVRFEAAAQYGRTKLIRWLQYELLDKITIDPERVCGLAVQALDEQITSPDGLSHFGNQWLIHIRQRRCKFCTGEIENVPHERHPSSHETEEAITEAAKG